MIDHELGLQQEIVARIARGEKISDPKDMPSEIGELIKKTIIFQWNCEYWGGINYLRSIHLGPTLAKRKIVRHIGQEELGHAFYLEEGPLAVLGVNPWAQLAQSVKEQDEILTIFQYPEKFITWGHFLMFNELQDRSAGLQLAELKQGFFAPWNAAIIKIEKEEESHIVHGERGIREWVKTEHGRGELQGALDDWLPKVLEVFGAPDEKSKRLKLYQKYGLKKSNDALRERFKAEIRPLLIEEIGLTSALL